MKYTLALIFCLHIYFPRLMAQDSTPRRVVKCDSLTETEFNREVKVKYKLTRSKNFKPDVWELMSMARIYNTLLIDRDYKSRNRFRDLFLNRFESKYKEDAFFILECRPAQTGAYSSKYDFYVGPGLYSLCDNYFHIR